MMNSCFITPLPIGVTGVISTKSTTDRKSPSTFSAQPARCTLQTPATSTSDDALQNSSPSVSTDSPQLLFQCPACKQPYPPVAPLQLQGLPNECPNCGSKVPHHDGFVDLTKYPSGTGPSLRNMMTEPLGQAIFELPLVTFLYERGWRDRFSAAGFPGIDVEFNDFLDYVTTADVVLDVSCASGLMARRLARSRKFKRVVASDYSESMMEETVKLARKDLTVPEFDAVRADVSALPFADNSIDAVHCGAALHCWPNVQDGLLEVFRVLKPGGKFYATTFLKLSLAPFKDIIFERPWLKDAVTGLEDFFLGGCRVRFFEQEEFEHLYKAVGFKSVTVETIQGCVIVKSEKAE